MKIALFTKHFLEPTHVAIAQVIRGLSEHTFHVFAKAFDDVPEFALANITKSTNVSDAQDLGMLAAECDLIHAVFDGNIAFQAFQLSRDLGKPFVLSFHGGFDTNAAIWKPKIREMTRQIAETASAVTVIGETDVRRLRELGVTREVSVVRVPVDFENMPSRGAGNSKTLVAIGRLVPKKGFDTAIRALEFLPASFHLVIVGTGPDAGRLQSIVKELGLSSRVDFVGLLPFSKTLVLLSQAKVLLHPARVAEDGNAEGTPQVLLCAQALGIPVVAGDSGSIRDVIDHGITGFLAPPNDPEQVANIISTLDEESSQRERVIESAIDSVRRKHGLAAIVKQWQRLYRDVVHQGAAIAPGLRELIASKSASFQAAFNGAVQAVAPLAAWSLLESGGQGVLFLGRAPPAPPVVLKVANYGSELKEDVELAERRIRKEGEILAELMRLRCDAVPRLYEAESHGKYLVREFIAGPTVHDIAQSFPLTARGHLIISLIKCAKMLFQICHQRPSEPYILRDFKPKNVVLDNERQRIVLVDVGSARPIQWQKDAVGSKVRLGTRKWLYWSPELLISHGRQADFSTDYFSLGATAFYLLAGHAPFSNSMVEIGSALESYRVEYSRVRREWEHYARMAQLPDDIAQFIEECMNPTASERPMEAFAC